MTETCTMFEAQRKAKRGEGVKWLREHTAHAGAGCLTWPFGRLNGYAGHVLFDGRYEYAHRLMCRFVHGAPPSPRHEASHSCGRGHRGCVDPRHLSWKTPSENQADRAKHGTKNVWAGRGKITQAEANAIRALKGVKPQREIAAQFGISRSNVSFIHCGKLWNRGAQQ